MADQTKPTKVVLATGTREGKARLDRLTEKLAESAATGLIPIEAGGIDEDWYQRVREVETAMMAAETPQERVALKEQLRELLENPPDKDLSAAPRREPPVFVLESSPPAGVEVGSKEWREHVFRKVDAMEIPGVIMAFTPEEAAWAGLDMSDEAFGAVTDEDIEAASADMAALHFTSEESSRLRTELRQERQVGAGEDDELPEGE